MTETVIFKQNSVIKTSPVGSDNLTGDEKASVNKWAELECDDISPDKNQHVLLTLTSAIKMQSRKKSVKKVYAYRPHVHLDGDINPEDAPNEGHRADFKLEMVYMSQRDNAMFAGCRPGGVQCNLTSCAMAAYKLLMDYSGVSLGQLAEQNGYDPNEPETYYGSILEKYGDTTDHAAQTEALSALGIDSYFSYTLSIPKLRKLIVEYKLPVVLGVAYGGSGHMIVANGVYPGGIYVHDPYGCRLGISDAYDPIGGEYDRYSNEALQQIWVDMGANAGWGRIITAVEGKSTGAPLNW